MEKSHWRKKSNSEAQHTFTALLWSSAVHIQVPPLLTTETLRSETLRLQRVNLLQSSIQCCLHHGATHPARGPFAPLPSAAWPSSRLLPEAVRGTPHIAALVLLPTFTAALFYHPARAYLLYMYIVFVLLSLWFIYLIFRLTVIIRCWMWGSKNGKLSLTHLKARLCWWLSALSSCFTCDGHVASL